jgi:integrase
MSRTVDGLAKVAGEKLLYRNSAGWYFLRKRGDGIDTDVCLDTQKKPEAIKARDAYLAARGAAKAGIAYDPNSSKARVSLKTVVERYQADGYPDENGNPGTDGRHLDAEKAYCATLLSVLSKELVGNLDQDKLDAYREARRRTVRAVNGKKDGARIVDLELNTLSKALNWAARKKLVDFNPIKERTRYHRASTARHCRECAPESADELHTIAGLLFGNPKSETLGWQLLFGGATGLRTNELLALRTDGRADEPGGVTDDQGSMCVRRSKSVGRDNPYIELRPDLRDLLIAHRAWKSQRFPKNNWYFPCRTQADDRPVNEGALGHSLQRLLRKELIKKPITPHGLRAFYVKVRRSNGIPDAQICVEIGHVGGVATMENVYGSIPPHWLKGDGPRLGFVPTKAPLGWTLLKPRTVNAS